MQELIYLTFLRTDLRCLLSWKSITSREFLNCYLVKLYSVHNMKPVLKFWSIEGVFPLPLHCASCQAKNPLQFPLFSQINLDEDFSFAKSSVFSPCSPQMHLGIQDADNEWSNHTMHIHIAMINVQITQCTCIPVTLYTLFNESFA